MIGCSASYQMCKLQAVKADVFCSLSPQWKWDLISSLLQSKAALNSEEASQWTEQSNQDMRRSECGCKSRQFPSFSEWQTCLKLNKTVFLVWPEISSILPRVSLRSVFALRWCNGAFRATVKGSGVQSVWGRRGYRGEPVQDHEPGYVLKKTLSAANLVKAI